MTPTPASGVALALAGVLVLTPDTLLMRLSGLSGFQMVAWRGLLSGAVLIAAWAITSRHRRRDLSVALAPLGLGAILCHWLNATLFATGIAVAPVAVVLLGVATVPVFSAVLGALVLGQRAGRRTWITIVAVLSGIALAILAGDGAGARLGGGALLGGFFGLSVAASFAMTFVLVRIRPDLPILLVIGAGAGCSGLNGAFLTGLDGMTAGTIWPIVITGAVILPLSFGAMTIASRLTTGTNVSLILLLETVLGPLWVWWGFGEPVPPLALLGGAVVVASLALYLAGERRERHGRDPAGVT